MHLPRPAHMRPDVFVVQPSAEQATHAQQLASRARRVQSRVATDADRLGRVLEQLTGTARAVHAQHAAGRPAGAASFAHITQVERLIELLNPRDVSGENSAGIAVTIMGLDVYVQDQGDQVAVSIGIDGAAKPAVIESMDGMSWEHPLP